jgi:hypothetical protein
MRFNEEIGRNDTCCVILFRAGLRFRLGGRKGRCSMSKKFKLNGDWLTIEYDDRQGVLNWVKFPGSQD